MTFDYVACWAFADSGVKSTGICSRMWDLWDLWDLIGFACWSRLVHVEINKIYYKGSGPVLAVHLIASVVVFALSLLLSLLSILSIYLYLSRYPLLHVHCAQLDRATEADIFRISTIFLAIGALGSSVTALTATPSDATTKEVSCAAVKQHWRVLRIPESTRFVFTRWV